MFPSSFLSAICRLTSVCSPMSASVRFFSGRRKCLSFSVIRKAALCSLLLAALVCQPAVFAAEAGEVPSVSENDPAQAVLQPFVCDEKGVLTGISTEYLEALAADGSATHTITLNIPASVNKIPVTGIGPQAFRLENYTALYPQLGLRFTGLNLANATHLVSIGDYAFEGCQELTGVLTLPSSLASVGKGAFLNTGYNTVYLSSSAAAYGNSAFGGKNLVAVICPDRASYTALSAEGIVTPAEKLTYPLTLSFQDDAGWPLAQTASREALYGMPLNCIRNSDGSWSVQKKYQLPSLSSGSDGYSWKWVFDISTGEAVTAASPVTGSILTAVRTLNPPEISFGEDIHTTYTGNPSRLTVTASHPAAHPEAEAAGGDVIFYYTWSWKDADGEVVTKKGYDLNFVEFTDACELSVSVLVQAAVKGDEQNEVFAEKSHTFRVAIQKAAPGYQISASVTSGKGSISVKDSTFTSSSLQAAAGEDITFLFTPEPGYKLGQVLLDKTDVTSQVVTSQVTTSQTAALQAGELSYTLKDVPSEENSSHTLTVSFQLMSQSDMQAVFDKLPVLKEGDDCSTETVRAFLEAKIQYEALRTQGAVTLSNQVLLRYYESLLALPAIRVEVAGNPAVTVSDTASLLHHMTGQEARALLEQSADTFVITVNVKETSLTSDQKSSIQALLDDARLAGSFDITITKSVTSGQTSVESSITENWYPLSLQFSLDKIPAAAKGYSRTYYVAGLHGNGQGRQTASLLANEDPSGKKLSVKSSLFSVFTVVYRDKKQVQSSPSVSQNSSGNSSSGNNSSGSNSGSSSGPSSSSGGSSSTYVPDYEKDFWDSVIRLIGKASPGDTVNVNAVTYDKMPAGVMAALREHPQVALIIRWDGGDPVIIPARTALAAESGRVYYPLSLLGKLYTDVNTALAGAAAQSSSAGTAGNTAGGASWEISAPAQSSTTYTPTSSSMGVEAPAETEAETESGTEPETTEPAETVDATESEPETETEKALDTKELTRKSESRVTLIVLIVSAVLLILVIVIIVVLLSIKKKQ